MSGRIEMIKYLREKTHRNLYDCKIALDICSDDVKRAENMLLSGIKIEKPFRTTIIDSPDYVYSQSVLTSKRFDEYNTKKTNRRYNMRYCYNFIVRIREDERGLLFKNGNYNRLLMPGLYVIFPFNDSWVEVYNIDEEFQPEKNIKLYLKDGTLKRELSIVDVPDNEMVIQFEEGRLLDVLTSGKYMYWKGLKDLTYMSIDLNQPEVENKIDKIILEDDRLKKYVSRFTIESYEEGLLFYDGVYKRKLQSGTYYFWNGPITVEIKKVDVRQLQLDMSGQEIMTKDKVTIRLNFIVQFKIADAKKVVIEVKDYASQLYILMQLILREYIGTLTLDEVLQVKEEIGTFVLKKLAKKADTFGLSFIHAGVKDIILPGDIKNILNQVIEAEKRAQANIITRREETASTRNLLNTAKLMENNPTLFKLKEMEYIERITDKLGTLTIGGDKQILSQLKELFGVQKV